MFYSHSILAKSGPFAHVWLAATWEKKLTRSMIFNTDIATAVGACPPRLPRAAPLLRARGRAPAPDRPPPRPRRIDREPVGAARAPAVGEPARRRRAHLRAQGASPASASIAAPPPPSPRRPPPPAPRAVARAPVGGTGGTAGRVPHERLQRGHGEDPHGVPRRRRRPARGERRGVDGGDHRAARRRRRPRFRLERPPNFRRSRTSTSWT